MTIRSKFKSALICTAIMLGSVLPNGIAGESVGRAIRLTGLRLLDSSASPNEIGAGKAEVIGKVPHPSFAVPEQVEQNDKTAADGFSAPGTDPSNIVPGTSIDSFDPAGSFSLGKILIKPSGTVSYTYVSNLQALHTGFQPDRALMIVPSIEAFLPFTRNGIRLDYSMPYRHYQRYDLPQGIDHILDADSQFELSPLLRLAIRDHFALSTLDSSEFTPGREVLFSNARFLRNNAAMQLDWTLSRNDSLELNADWNRVSFKDVTATEARPFYDFDTYGFAAKYGRYVSERLKVFAGAGHTRMAADDPRRAADFRRYELDGGVEGAITPLISSQMTVGVTFDQYPGTAKDFATGLLLRGSVVKAISERSQLSLSLSRITNPSNFQQNAYFVTTGLGGTYSRELRPNLALTFSASYQRNAYPLPLQSGSEIPVDLVGLKSRRDSFIDAGVVVRYRYNHWLAMDLLFAATQRHSDIPGYQFSGYRGGISILFGNGRLAEGRSISQ